MLSRYSIWRISALASVSPSRFSIAAALAPFVSFPIFSGVPLPYIALRGKQGPAMQDRRAAGGKSIVR
jgi:hypothetical protein